MNATHSFLLTALALLVVDLPWLSLIGGPYGEVVQKIQGGRPMVTRPLAGIPVYFALAYLVLKAESVQEAFFIGMTTYAVYDFTVMAVFKEYTLGIALADTLWGGLLFGIVYYLKKKFQF